MRVNPLKWEKIPTTVQPPVSDHPKCEDLVVTFENQTRYRSRGIYLLEIIALSHNVCGSMLSLTCKVLHIL